MIVDRGGIRRWLCGRLAFFCVTVWLLGSLTLLALLHRRVCLQSSWRRRIGLRGPILWGPLLLILLRGGLRRAHGRALLALSWCLYGTAIERLTGICPGPLGLKLRGCQGRAAAAWTLLALRVLLLHVTLGERRHVRARDVG